MKESLRLTLNSSMALFNTEYRAMLYGGDVGHVASWVCAALCRNHSEIHTSVHYWSVTIR
jgi:hypothetical protein